MTLAPTVEAAPLYGATGLPVAAPFHSAQVPLAADPVAWLAAGVEAPPEDQADQVAGTVEALAEAVTVQVSQMPVWREVVEDAEGETQVSQVAEVLEEAPLLLPFQLFHSPLAEEEAAPLPFQLFQFPPLEEEAAPLPFQLFQLPPLLLLLLPFQLFHSPLAAELVAAGAHGSQWPPVALLV